MIHVSHAGLQHWWVYEYEFIGERYKWIRPYFFSNGPNVLFILIGWEVNDYMAGVFKDATSRSC